VVLYVVPAWPSETYKPQVSETNGRLVGPGQFSWCSPAGSTTVERRGEQSTQGLSLHCAHNRHRPRGPGLRRTPSAMAIIPAMVGVRLPGFSESLAGSLAQSRSSSRYSGGVGSYFLNATAARQMHVARPLEDSSSHERQNEQRLHDDAWLRERRLLRRELLRRPHLHRKKMW
jgi:hypothetical protein